MDVLTKELDRCRGIAASAYDRALQSKAADGGMMDTLTPQVSTLSDWTGQRQQREQYSYFRGWLYAAVNALASEAAGQPVNVGKLQGAESKKGASIFSGAKGMAMGKMTPTMRSKAARQELEILMDHPLIDSLEQPNPIQHRWQFVYSFVANLNLTGWAYIVFGENDEGALEFYSLPTTWVRPDHSKGPFAEFHIVNPKKLEAKSGPPLSRDNVGFAHLPNPSDPLSAIAPAASQSLAIRVDDHIQTSQERFFGNGIFPSSIVTIGKDPHPEVPGGMRPRLTAAQRRQVIGVIRKTWGGVVNYGHPAIVDGMIEKIDRLSMSQNEMGWEKSEMRVRTRILSAFGVHPYILGEPVGVGGYAQAAKIEERFCKRVNTFLDMLSTVITNLVGNAEKRHDLWVWWEKCEPNDPSLYWSNIRAARQNDDISQNEFRALLGLPPDEDRNESVLNKSAIGGVVQLLAQVGAGAISSEQARGILVGLGLPDDLAGQIAGKASTAPQSEEQLTAHATEELKAAVKMLRQTPREAVGRIVNEARLLPRLV